MSYNKLNDLYKEYDAIMITSPYNLRYFTGFSGGEGICIAGKDFRYLLVDSRYIVAAKCEAKNFTVIEYSVGKLYEVISDVIKAHNVLNLGFENAHMTVAELERYSKNLININFVGVDNRLNELRMIKTEQELNFIRKAESIGCRAFEKILPMLKVGVCEREIASELEYQMRCLGAQKTSFDTIVVSGTKTSMPHGLPDDTRLKSGDFVTMDFGCRYNGYCSDMTRTVVIEKANDEQIKIYNTVQKAQSAGLDAIRNGACCKDVDAVARDIIKEAGYGGYFGHSLGHGVGLQIHELPNLSPKSDMILEENMVVSCEPGIYVEGFGGVRIEDLVIVKHDGIENLCDVPKDLIICG